MRPELSSTELERLKRIAAQLLVQLPENKEEALVVLTVLRELVDWQPTLGAVVASPIKIVG